MLNVPSDTVTNRSNDGWYVILEPKLTSLIGIESIISVGLAHLFEIKEHCIRIEFTFDPIGVKVDNTLLDAVAGDDGYVPASKPIIVFIDPVDARTSWGVLAVVGNPYAEESMAYKPLEGRVYVPIDEGTK